MDKSFRQKVIERVVFGLILLILVSAFFVVNDIQFTFGSSQFSMGDLYNTVVSMNLTLSSLLVWNYNQTTISTFNQSYDTYDYNQSYFEYYKRSDYFSQIGLIFGWDGSNNESYVVNQSGQYLSGSLMNGLIAGNVQVNGTGKHVIDNNATEFNKDVNLQYILFGTVNMFTNTSYTVNIWAKDRDCEINPTDSKRMLTGTTLSGSNGFTLRRNRDTNSTGYVHVSGAFINVNFNSPTHPSSFWCNWNMFTAVLNGTTNGILYENGVQVAQDASPVGLDSSTISVFKIGGSSTDRQWNGSMDEVHIWNRALDGGEISSLYNKSFLLGTGQITSTYNSTYSQFSYNQSVFVNSTFNQTFTDDLYSSKIWNYNQSVFNSSFNVLSINQFLYSYGTIVFPYFTLLSSSSKYVHIQYGSIDILSFDQFGNLTLYNYAHDPEGPNDYACFNSDGVLYRAQVACDTP